MTRLRHKPLAALVTARIGICNVRPKPPFADTLFDMALHTIFGAGPIGLSLGKQLLCAGHQVRIASRRGTTLEGALTLRLDASDQAEAIKAADGAEVVYNCVNVPYQLWEAELPRLFGSILHAAEHNKSRLVLLDNLYTYYPVNGPLTELSEESPVGPKGKLRLQLAKEHLQAHKTGKVEVAIARASDFYGPQMTNVHLGERVFKPLAQARRSNGSGIQIAYIHLPSGRTSPKLCLSWAPQKMPPA